MVRAFTCEVEDLGSNPCSKQAFLEAIDYNGWEPTVCEVVFCERVLTWLKSLNPREGSWL